MYDSQEDVVKTFFKELVADRGRTAYGQTQVRENLKLDAVELLLISEDLILTKELTFLADNSTADVFVISTDFDEGMQLRNAFGGIAAVLTHNTGI